MSSTIWARCYPLVLTWNVWTIFLKELSFHQTFRDESYIKWLRGLMGWAKVGHGEGGIEEPTSGGKTKIGCLTSMSNCFHQFFQPPHTLRTFFFVHPPLTPENFRTPPFPTIINVKSLMSVCIVYIFSSVDDLQEVFQCISWTWLELVVQCKFDFLICCVLCFECNWINVILFLSLFLRWTF